MPYHHGDLRRALLDTALEAVGELGPATLSLRDVARRAGVSHAAPTHHFRDKTALLTALAAEGWSLLADALGEATADGRDFAELGVAYVVFATSHPAHFAVMRAPGLARGDDPDLVAAMERARAQLRAGVRHFEAGSTRDTDTTGRRSAPRRGGGRLSSRRPALWAGLPGADGCVPRAPGAARRPRVPSP